MNAFDLFLKLKEISEKELMKKVLYISDVNMIIQYVEIEDDCLDGQ
ncbi:hypothetical protein FJB42_000598 [Enterococcus faecalis]|nr:hypothetical protein [Enterococcus faecalis]EFM67241.1 hypothetical protein HMPREF9509_01788 [Enterococcus faecalis TX0411]EGO7797674.1 hypothetical protein [Enterococcus faecalis]NSQ74117.1 hypothetical protein [Enterococcus faecalis]HAP5356437.1 hypothetical protein [Enterococcus faecalis]HDV0809709.1 hypothetical protein [Enterococcus faecalis]